MGLYKERQITELYNLKHKHDNSPHKIINYEDKILKKTMTTFIFHNDIMNEYLERLQGLVSILFDQVNVRRNFKNYLVDKYYNKHIN